MKRRFVVAVLFSAAMATGRTTVLALVQQSPCKQLRVPPRRRSS